MPRAAANAAVSIKLSKLELDRQNPRLPIPPRAGQNLIRQLLIEQEDVVSLANEIIAGGGLLPTDNIVVVREGQRYVVLEGNRRVAACQIIDNPTLLPISERGRLRTANISPALKRSTSQLTAIVVRAREDALTMIAKKHTSQGTRQWRPAAKARFVATLHEQGKTVAQIAQLVQDSTGDIKRLLLEKHLLDVASGSPDLKDVATDQYTKANAFTRFFTLGPARRAFPIKINDEGDLDKGDLSDAELRQTIIETGRAFLLKRDGGTKPMFDTRDDATNVLQYLRARNATVKRITDRRTDLFPVSSQIPLDGGGDPSIQATPIVITTPAGPTEPTEIDHARSGPSSVAAPGSGRTTLPAPAGPIPQTPILPMGPPTTAATPTAPTGSLPTAVPTRGRPKVEAFFKGMPCTFQDNILQQVAGELSRVDHQKFPSAAHYLMRATLEQTLWYYLKQKHKVGDLKTFASSQANAGAAASTATLVAVSSPSSSVPASSGAPRVGTQQPRHLPGLEIMISFCIQDTGVFSQQTARTLLGQIRSNKQLADLVIHGHALANPALVETAASLVRPFLEKIYDGTYN